VSFTEPVQHTNISLLYECDDETNVILDRYVQSHPNGSIYHLSAWRNAIELAYKHHTMVLIAMKGPNIVGFLPLCCMSIPILGKLLVALPFADYCSAIADEPEIETQLIEEAKRQFIRISAKKLEIRDSQIGLAQSKAISSSEDPSEDHISHLKTKVRMLVHLPASADLLMASYKPKLRSQIKKAQKNGLTAKIADDDDALNHFYRVYARNMHRLGSPVHSLRWFQALRKNLLLLEAFKVVLIDYQESVVGAAIVLHFGKSAWIPWASTLADYNHLAPNMLMYWQIQAYLADRGVRVFDMGRSTVGEGTYRFKAQWGAEAVPLNWTVYGQTDISDNRDIKTDSVKLRRLAEKMWRLLPLPVATAFGAYLRRYISL
jgi:FemAB-related protein (PEP-CTERM system-associated)